jgi:hypothetical protein
LVAKPCYIGTLCGDMLGDCRLTVGFTSRFEHGTTFAEPRSPVKALLGSAKLLWHKPDWSMIDMNPTERLLRYVVPLLQEPSTWRGIVLITTSLGVTLSPEQAANITAIGLAIAGLIGAAVRDPPRE